MKTILCCLFLAFSTPALACGDGGFGNGGDGCADNVLGVQTVSGDKIEITTSGTSWYAGHTCTGATVVQFAGTDLEKKAALSIAMTVYTSGKGPIFFRCTEKLSDGVCSCSNIVLGNSWRD